MSNFLPKTTLDFKDLSNLSDQIHICGHKKKKKHNCKTNTFLTLLRILNILNLGF